MSKLNYILVLFSTQLIGFSIASAAGLISFENGFKLVESTPPLNMPPVRSQDGVGLCGSFAAAVMLDFTNCRIEKKDCSQLPPHEQVSSLDMSRFIDLADATKDPAADVNRKVNIGGYAGLGLNALIQNSYTIAKESCAPFEPQLSLDKKSSEQAYNDFEALKAKFEKKRNDLGSCIECLASDIKKTFPQLSSFEQLTEKLKETDFQKFLYKLWVPEKCLTDKSMQLRVPNVSYISYPKDTAGIDADKILDKVKKVITGRPPEVPGLAVAVDGVCVDSVFPIDPKDCKTAHSLVIAGVGRMCDSTHKCYDAFKVQNSWGQRWQEANSDGWIDAREIIKRTHLQAGKFSWLK